MATGTPYFAWIAPGDTTFNAGHLRWDEEIVALTLAESEGDPASLSVTVKRPQNASGVTKGLLGPGRSIWAWFAFDCGTGLIKARMRLVGIPRNIFQELVTLEFTARPVDMVAQKEALANSLRTLPGYDEVVLDPPRRTDPEVVLEGYTKIWHYNRETHVMSVTDVLTGEDGLVTFDGVSEAGKTLYDGLGMSFSSGPLSSVEMYAEFEWTQIAQGSVDLTEYLTDNWPNEGFIGNGIITSFTFGSANWPKNGAGIGDGWKATEASCVDVYGLEVQNKTEGGKTIAKWWDGETTSVEQSRTINFLKEIPPGSIEYPAIVTQDDISIKYSDNGEGGKELTSFNRQTNVVPSVLPLHHLRATLIAGYEAERRCTERVSFTLVADVQSILTDPEDGEALRIDNIRSVNLSETIGEGTDAYIPIVDPARRSYICTERGNDSLEHLIALGRAHLMKRSRVVEITFAPKLSRMPEITLRKNVLLNEPRVGEALGKVIGYSLSLEGGKPGGGGGRINCEVKIGCTIGRGGSAVATAGTPTYCSITYCGNDYQQFTGKTVLFDSSVGYEPPNANPNDDGINFQSPLFAADVVEQELVVENPPDDQREDIEDALAGWVNPPMVPPPLGLTQEQRQELVNARSEAVNNALKEIESRATFKLKSMKREFVTDYPVAVTDLKIPTGYDLEAA